MSNKFKEQLKSLLRKFISRKKIEILAISLFSKYKFTSSLYYVLFNTSFAREHQAVLLGRLEYYQSLKNIETSSVLLRRNIHRLEKGLIMQPRKPIFAAGFILETVQTYALAITQGQLTDSESRWVNDVLTEYFTVVKSDIIVDKAREEFRCIKVSLTDNKLKCFTPYTHSEIHQSQVSSKQLAALFKQRRSVRWYEKKTVDISKVNIAVDMASQAPSACNRQPFRLHVVVKPCKVQQVADCAMGTKGFSHNIPMIIAVVGDLSSYPLERDRHLIYIDGSLMSMQFMLALETLGLSSCPINWPEIESREVMLESIIELESHERPIMLIAVGHAKADGGIPFSQKKSHSELIKLVD